MVGSRSRLKALSVAAAAASSVIGRRRRSSGVTDVVVLMRGVLLRSSSGPRLSRSGVSTERAGFDSEDLEVVVQEHGLPVADSDAFMTGDEATPIEDQHL